MRLGTAGLGVQACLGDLRLLLQVTNGRRKGAVAEREVADLLEALWGQFEPGAKFVRTPKSGGWGTPVLRGEFQTAGDLVTTSPTFPFGVEVKRREGWVLKNVLAGRQSPIWAWWEQATIAAAEMKKAPILFLKKSRESWRVIVPASVEVHGWSEVIEVKATGEKVRLTTPQIMFVDTEASRAMWRLKYGVPCTPHVPTKEA